MVPTARFTGGQQNLSIGEGFHKLPKESNSPVKNQQSTQDILQMRKKSNESAILVEQSQRIINACSIASGLQKVDPLFTGQD